MATKTISVDMEAYRKLQRARRSPEESFSQVIHRAVWPDPGKTCGAFLELVERLPIQIELFPITVKGERNSAMVPQCSPVTGAFFW